MKKRLPRPLDAEIINAAGELACVQLVTYLGESHWQARQGDGQALIVEASQILTLSANDRGVAQGS